MPSHKYICPQYPHILHGGDYNPEQWLHMPEVIKEDIRLMNAARCNIMSIGIFAWASLEPEEGKFQFDWLDHIMNLLADNNIYAALATPSGARPVWMSLKYNEVLRVGKDRRRNLHGHRHNHCFTSPIYRQKINIINTKLAQRYNDHPALLIWHISNEYGGECHCPLCQQAFRTWLKEKYHNNIDALNKAWWTAFWSHTYSDFAQIESPATHGENIIHGHNIDWKRFVTHQTIDFMKHEMQPLKSISPDVPVTTNMYYMNKGLNYWKFKDELDVISWDSYPQWHSGKAQISTVLFDDQAHTPDLLWAGERGFAHDMFRSMKHRPIMLMESTPSVTNWHRAAKQKRPGMHMLSSIHPIAHGSDTVQYFQWRKSCGGPEKFHGAVVDHVGHEHTRVFNDVAQLGKVLQKLDDIAGTSVDAEVAVMFDWENWWAIDDALGPRNDGLRCYIETCQKHYLPFWEAGINTDVIDMECDPSRYKLLIAPMLYMLRDGVSDRIQQFVENGGVFVCTYWTGIVDENDLCFLGGFPGPLRKVLGIWSEELDAIQADDSNQIVIINEESPGVKGQYQAKHFCDLIHAESAKVLAEYKADFYAGRPALTRNQLGNGQAFYIASRNEYRFVRDFYRGIASKLNLKRSVNTDLPTGIVAKSRTDREYEYIFLMNFNPDESDIKLDDQQYDDVLDNNQPIETPDLKLAGYGVKLLRRKSM